MHAPVASITINRWKLFFIVSFRMIARAPRKLFLFPCVFGADEEFSGLFLRGKRKKLLKRGILFFADVIEEEVLFFAFIKPFQY